MKQKAKQFADTAGAVGFILYNSNNTLVELRTEFVLKR